jgi:hypothetical protein
MSGLKIESKGSVGFELPLPGVNLVGVQPILLSKVGNGLLPAHGLKHNLHLECGIDLPPRLLHVCPPNRSSQELVGVRQFVAELLSVDATSLLMNKVHR